MFIALIFCALRILEDLLRCFVILVLFSCNSVYEVQCAASKENAIQLVQQRKQFFFPDVVWDRNNVRTSPLHEFLVDFKYVLVVVELVFLVSSYWLCQNSNDWEVTRWFHTHGHVIAVIFCPTQEVSVAGEGAQG